MTKIEQLLLYFARSNHTKHHIRGQKLEACRSETCKEVVAALQEAAGKPSSRSPGPRTP